MKTVITAAAATACIFVAVGVTKATMADVYDKARVIQVSPMFETLKEHGESCEYHLVEVEKETTDISGQIIGGIIGGIAGNQFGKGSGKEVATAAGVILGSVIGNNIRQRNQEMANSGQYERVRLCSPTYKEREELVGYKVDYIYKGKYDSTFLTYNPGRFIDGSELSK